MDKKQNFINIKELRENSPTLSSCVENLCDIIHCEGTITFDMEFVLEQNIRVFGITYDNHVYRLVKANGKWQYIEHIN